MSSPATLLLSGTVRQKGVCVRILLDGMDPDDMDDEALSAWGQAKVKELDDAREQRTSHAPPARLEWQAAGWRRTLFLEQYALHPKFTRELSAMYEEHRAAIAALPPGTPYSHIRFSYPARYNEAIQAYLRDLYALAEAYHLHWFRQTSGPLAYFGFQAIHTWCIWMIRGLARDPSDFGCGTGFPGTTPVVDDSIRIDAIEDPARLDLESRDVIEARIRSCFERAMKDALGQCAAGYERAGYKRGDTETQVRTYAQWTFRRFVMDKHFKDIAKAVYVADESVRLRTNEFAKMIGFSPCRTRRRVHE